MSKELLLVALEVVHALDQRGLQVGPADVEGPLHLIHDQVFNVDLVDLRLVAQDEKQVTVLDLILLGFAIEQEALGHPLQVELQQVGGERGLLDGRVSWRVPRSGLVGGRLHVHDLNYEFKLI